MPYQTILLGKYKLMYIAYRHMAGLVGPKTNSLGRVATCFQNFQN